MNLHVSEATLNDAKTIADFNSRMAVETEGRPLDRELIDPGVESVLADSNKGRYWVAEMDGNVVGQIMIQLVGNPTADIVGLETRQAFTLCGHANLLVPTSRR